jgi:hypothetical protein
MKTFGPSTIRCALAATVAAMAFGAAPSRAADIPPVGYISVAFDVSPVLNEITVSNVATNKSLGALDLQYDKQATVSFAATAQVICVGTVIDNAITKRGWTYDRSFVRFGNIPGQLVDESNDLNQSSAQLASIVEGAEAQQLVGTTTMANPVDVVLQAANAAPSKLEFLRNDQVLQVILPVHFRTRCHEYERNKVTKDTLIEADQPFATDTAMLPVKIVYKGDPELNLLSVNLQGVPAGSVQAQKPTPPLNVVSGEIVAKDGNFVGQCPATAGFEVELHGEGEGEVRYRVLTGQNVPIYQSPALPFSGKGATWADGFSHQILWEGPQSLETKENQWVLQVVAKEDDEPYFPAIWKNAGYIEWTSRCLPKLNVELGGQSHGKLAQPSQGNQAPTLGLNAVTDLPKPVVPAQPGAVQQPAPVQPAAVAQPTAPAPTVAQPAPRPETAAPGTRPEPTRETGRIPSAQPDPAGRPGSAPSRD